MNKDTMMMVAVLACVLAVLYLYREVHKLKKVPVKQSAPYHAPVHDTYKSVPVPVYVPAPPAPVYVPAPVQVPAAQVLPEEK